MTVLLVLVRIQTEHERTFTTPKNEQEKSLRVGACRHNVSNSYVENDPPMTIKRIAAFLPE
jgi:hypothetical protein